MRIKSAHLRRHGAKLSEADETVVIDAERTCMAAVPPLRVRIPGVGTDARWSGGCAVEPSPATPLRVGREVIVPAQSVEGRGAG